MYGKHFASMYTGSMVGAGAIKFAVMGYVISNAHPDSETGMQVELNPKLLAAILGEKITDVEKAIEFLCLPDPNSRSKAEGGRRLIKVGQFDYKVVNGLKYREIRDEEERRRQNRESQARFRSKRRTKPMSGEIANQKLMKQGATQEELDNHATQIVEEQQEDRWP